MDNRYKRLASSPAFWIRGLFCGLVSGVGLGLFLKIIEQASGHLVYRLLLNVDFVSFLPPRLPEWIEFGLHLMVALAIGLVYAFWNSILAYPRPLLTATVLGLLSSLLFFPLASLSDRVPAPGDMQAFGWWFAGHLLFGILLYASNRTMQLVPFANGSDKA